MPRASTAVKVASIEEYLRGLSQQGDPEKLLQAAMEVIGRLSERLDAQLRARYSPKSEQIDPAQLQLMLAEQAREQDASGGAAEATCADEPTTPAPSDEPVARPKRVRDNHPGRRPLPATLPREEQRRRPEQTDCCECGKALHTIRDEKSELLEWVPGHFKVIVEVREVLACSCGNSKPVTATAGPRVIEGGLPGPGLVALVLISKYRDHLPLERQAKIYQRHGIDLSPKTIVGWVEAGAWMLSPVAQAIHERVLKSHVVQADDTHLLVLQRGDEKKKGGKGTSRGRIWAFVGDGSFVSYAYAPNWKGEHPQRMLGGRTGWLQGDGYAGYAELYAREGGPIEAGAERAAIIYTILESAVLHGHEPWAYLSDVLAKLAAGWPQSRLDELLPDRWTPAVASP